MSGGLISKFEVKNTFCDNIITITEPPHKYRCLEFWSIRNIDMRRVVGKAV
jgi:hypothetical protein